MLRIEAEHLPVGRDFVIFDESDQQALMRQVLKDLQLDPKQYPPNRLRRAISGAKNELVEVEDYPAASYFDELVRRAYARYQQLLVANNALDFDDLLFWVVRLLRQHASLRERYRQRFRHILVDEFQDTNSAQYSMLRLLAGEEADLFVVGDPDQSIYRWRGADYRNVRRFQRDYPAARVILLEQNYRSTQRILDAAMAVIDRLPGRRRKQLFTERGAGPALVLHEAYDEADEAAYVVETIGELARRGEVSPGQVAVMYRTNAQSRALEEAFLRADMPYRLVGAQRFYGRREVKDLIAYLRLAHNPRDQVSLLRALNTPPRGIGAKTAAALQQAAAELNLSAGELLLSMEQGPPPELERRLASRALQALGAFGALLNGWRQVARSQPLLELIDRILEDTGFRHHLEDGTEEGMERWANVLELRRVAQEFSDLGLETFLEHVALISDQDTLSDQQDVPTLLTLHAAKGLEFPVVFIVGLDDGLLPHQRSFDDPESMAEERRLFYVGLTRAKDRVFLVRCFRRRLFGSSELTTASRFLYDLPAELLEGELLSLGAGQARAVERLTRWDATPATAPPTARFQVGMRVLHPRFGEGIVMESRVEQGEEEVTVAFERVGLKRLAASLAGLQILDESG